MVKILKVVKENIHITFKGIKIRFSVKFSAESIEFRRQWNIFEVLREYNSKEELHAQKDIHQKGIVRFSEE